MTSNSNREPEFNPKLSTFIAGGSDEDFDTQTKREQLMGLKDNRNHRKKLIRWVEWNVSGWLFCVIAILSSCGFGWMDLDSVVLTTLLATTTVNILGLAFIVLKGLFDHNQVP